MSDNDRVVYVVTADAGGDDVVVAVYDDPVLAGRCADRFEGRVATHPLNRWAAELGRGLAYWRLGLHRDGALAVAPHACAPDPDSPAGGWWLTLGDARGAASVPGAWQRACLWWVGWADGALRAVERANEVRGVLLAAGRWPDDTVPAGDRGARDGLWQRIKDIRSDNAPPRAT